MTIELQSVETINKPSRFRLSFVLPMILIAAAFTMLIWQLLVLVQTSLRMTASHQVIAQVRQLERMIPTIQSNLRGYQLTGNEEFLQEFHSEVAQMTKSIARLEAIAPEERTRSRLEQISFSLDAWISAASKRAITRNPKFAKGWNEVSPLRSALDGQFEDFLANEDARLSSREIRAVRSVKWVFAAVIAAMLGSGLIFWRNFLYSRKVNRLRETSEKRSRQLAGLGSILVQFMDPVVTFRSVGQFCVDEIADWVILHYTDRSNDFHRLGMIHRDPKKQLLCDQLAKFPIADSGLKLLEGVVSKQHASLAQDIQTEQVEGRSFNKEAAKLTLEIGIKSFVTAPLIAHGKALGTITFIQAKENYTFEDVPFLEEFARRTAISMENARLFRLAQKAIKAREDVVAIVSHDLRNPLSAVQLGADLIRKCLLLPWNESVKEQIDSRLECIDRSVDQATFLIQDILDVTKIDSDSLVIEKRPVNPVHLINEAVEVIKPLAEQKRIRIDLRLPKAEMVLADRGRILQVVSNLLGNSLKFTPDGGSILIRLSHSANSLLFSIRDSGPGIPKENLPHIFDRYWQAQSHQAHGLGLGLSIARGIVMAHGGKIWVESQLGLGTTFYFTLPIPPAAELQKEISV